MVYTQPYSHIHANKQQNQQAHFFLPLLGILSLNGSVSSFHFKIQSFQNNIRRGKIISVHYAKCVFILLSSNRCECINLFCPPHLHTCVVRRHTFSKIHPLTSPFLQSETSSKSSGTWSIIITNVHVKWLSDNQKTSEFYACLREMAAQVVV